MKDLNVSGLCDVYGSLLTENQRTLVRDYFDYDLSLSEIAAERNISRQGALDTIKTGQRELMRYESVLHIVEHSRETKEAIACALCALKVGDSVEVERILSELNERL